MPPSPLADETVKSMLNIFLRYIDVFGYVPNGGRWYYEKRSQVGGQSARCLTRARSLARCCSRRCSSTCFTVSPRARRRETPSLRSPVRLLRGDKRLHLPQSQHPLSRDGDGILAAKAPHQRDAQRQHARDVPLSCRFVGACVSGCGGGGGNVRRRDAYSTTACAPAAEAQSAAARRSAASARCLQTATCRDRRASTRTCNWVSGAGGALGGYWWARLLQLRT